MGFLLALLSKGWGKIVACCLGQRGSRWRKELVPSKKPENRQVGAGSECVYIRQETSIAKDNFVYRP